MNRLASDNMTCLRDDCGVFIRVSKGMVRIWFDIGTIHVLRCMQCNLILALPAFVRCAEADWDAIGDEWSSF